MLGASSPRTPRLRAARRLGALALVAALVACGGCGLRLGEGSPASLETAPQAETVRDSLARQALLISSTAQVISQEGGQVPADLPASAEAQAQALGGVWEPWATAVPTTYPTATPLATAQSGASLADLSAALEQGAAAARQAAASAQSAQDAQLYTALAVSWSVSLEQISPGSASGVPRSGGSTGGSTGASESSGASAGSSSSGAPRTGEAISGQLLAVYDAARYACEEVGARSEDDAVRERAVQDARAATFAVNASIAAGGEDTRLPAYAPAEGADDATWAGSTWADVAATEVQETAQAQASTPQRQAAVEAAIDAGLRAYAWGVQLPALPGYAAS